MFSALVLSQPTAQPREQKAQGDLSKVYKKPEVGPGEKRQSQRLLGAVHLQGERQ